MKQLNWATLGCGVIANELAQALSKEGRTLYSVANRTGTSYCEERRHHPRWQHLRQKQSGRRAGICIYIGKGEVKSGVILQNLSNQKK